MITYFSAGLLAQVQHFIGLPIHWTVTLSIKHPITVAGPRRIQTGFPFKQYGKHFTPKKHKVVRVHDKV